MTHIDEARGEAHMLISSDRVEGTAVYNRDGNRLGTISSLMIHKRSGQVEYAILSFGGIFGIGSDHYPLPWSQLDYDTGKHGYVVDMTRETLLSAPSFPPESPPKFGPSFVQDVKAYYRGAR
ncbi:MAG TPA: PRC-barrel domain-containing protein [Sphingobium sp.]|nr:PRC-barrel domain-containing protein [Sphingobium sp.]